MIQKIGITGHQKLCDPAGWRWVKSALNGELDAFETPAIAVSSLAIGADQLFVSLVAMRGGQICAVIPFHGYEQTFSPEAANEYHRLLAQASTVETLQIEGTNEDKYLAAGKRIVELSDVVIAVWDGKPAKGKGGTADIVSYISDKKRSVIYINRVNKTITRQQGSA